MTGPAARGDAGATLAEVVVAMALAVLVAGLGGTQLVSAQRSAAQTSGRVQALEAQRAAFAQVPRMLRTATPIGTISSTGVASSEPAVVSGTDRELTVFVNSNPLPSAGPAPSPSPGAAPAPRQVRYVVDGSELTQHTTLMVLNDVTGTYSVSAAPGHTTVRTLVTGLVDPQPHPVFTYVQAPTACSPVPADGCPVTLTGAGQDAGVRSSVRGVGLSLWVEAPQVRTGSRSRLTSRVTFPTTQELRG